MDNKFSPDYTKPPVSGKNPDFKFPEYRLLTLDNGLECYIHENNEQPLIHLKLNYLTGSANDTNPGLSSFSTTMLRRGTKSRSAKEVSEVADNLGGSIGGKANLDYAGMSLKVLGELSGAGIELLNDCILEPAFSSEEIDRLRKEKTADLMQEYADTNYLAKQALFACYYRGHQYSIPADGTLESIAGMNDNACTDWHDRLIKSPAIAVISGSFERDNLLDKLSNIKLNSNRVVDNHFMPQPGRKVVISNFEAARQSTLMAAFPAIGRDNPDYAALQLLNIIFGGYFLSRLNYILREKKGYTYGVHSAVAAMKQASAIKISTNISNANIRDAIDTILAEIRRIGEGDIEENELTQARMYMMGSFVRSIETPAQVGGFLNTIAVFGLRQDFFDNYFRHLSGIGIEELRETGRKYFNPESITIAAAGNGNELKKELSGFGDMFECSIAGEITQIAQV